MGMELDEIMPDSESLVPWQTAVPIEYLVRQAITLGSYKSNLVKTSEEAVLEEAPRISVNSSDLHYTNQISRL